MLNSLLDTIMEKTTFPAVVVDSGKKVIRFNRHFLEMTGQTKDMLRSKPSLEFIDHCRCSKVKRQQPTRDAPNSPLYRIENVNGDTLFFRVHEVPFEEAHEEYTLLIFQDETEKAVLREENQHMARLASVGELVSSVIHEIGNCTAIIKGCSELLEMNKSLDQNIHEEAGRIKSESERISEVIKSFLGFARKGDNELEVFSSEDLVINALDLKKYSLRRKGIVYHIDMDVSQDSNLLVSGNKTLLMQVLLNLIANAEEALRDSEKKEIKFRLNNNDQNALIEVSDSGSGISEKVRSKIFESFYTTKDAGSGTGLGLSISRRIVRDHQGDLVLKKEMGDGGATFKITLPLVDLENKIESAKREGTV